MSTVKLTLSIPKRLLGEAKAYSRKTRQPLSRLVSRYFALLARTTTQDKTAGMVGPRVKQATGLAKGARAAEQVLLEALVDKYR